ncbi:fumarylacetoacetate hydrolase family protein [Amycolatopsis carbonis]|uniref:Fumarylacetoacetate hydrolase family protein n=1 Tax=Amycolatopsis carbonis TaxID=715471 RepID=A0A9Y2MVN4_9PSEU|nr:fumarylacetoacetate hydrolase family protein [Amycolatopsis sp. 2-15]WIX83080.1 fumarylacetoacetate hydrolase family protein [Amycolatopsis sp. 2-15]
MTDDDLARRLTKATHGGPAVAPAPVADLAHAYRVSRAICDLALAAGDRLAGYKVGLTSEPARATYGATEPAFGHVLASTVLQPGQPLSTADMFAPRAEVEIAFILGRSLSGPDTTAEDVVAATAAIAPAFEIVDSRWSGGPTTLAMLAADNTNAAYAFLGPQAPLPQDLSGLECTLKIGDKAIPGSAAAVMNGNPAAAVAWLANHLAAAGESLPAGAMVLTGTLCAPTPFTGGDTLFAEVSGLGNLTLATQ